MLHPYECRTGEPSSEADHFIQCGCGAWLDMRDLAQIMDHDETCKGPRAEDDASKPSPTAN